MASGGTRYTSSLLFLGKIPARLSFERHCILVEFNLSKLTSVIIDSLQTCPSSSASSFRNATQTYLPWPRSQHQRPGTSVRTSSNPAPCAQLCALAGGAPRCIARSLACSRVLFRADGIGFLVSMVLRVGTAVDRCFDWSSLIDYGGAAVALTVGRTHSLVEEASL